MIHIDIVNKSKRWQGDSQAKIESFIEKTCRDLIPLTGLNTILSEDVELELSISLVSDQQIKKINRQFRDKDKATNVLSFPALDENVIRDVGLKELVAGDPYVFLGDIILSYQTIQKESLAQKKSFDNHLTHLILHSILHLIGFDHEDDKEADEMENLEINILKTLNIQNPYLI